MEISINIKVQDAEHSDIDLLKNLLAAPVPIWVVRQNFMKSDRKKDESRDDVIKVISQEKSPKALER